MAQDLVELVTNQNATDLVINGDIKSGTDRISNSEWDNVPKFFSKLSSACKVTAVPGNHDAGLAHLLPKDVEIADMNGFVVGDNLLIHGHTKPLPKFSTCRRIIIGHLHPTYNEKGNPLSGMPVWLMCKIRREKIFGGMIQILNSNKSKQGFDDLMEVVVMPSFNRDLGLLGFWRDATSEERRSAPLLRDLKNSDSAVVITLDGEIIGDETLLPRVL
jgi:metallophosphoesterase superfamily enzyme